MAARGAVIVGLVAVLVLQPVAGNWVPTLTILISTALLAWIEYLAAREVHTSKTLQREVASKCLADAERCRFHERQCLEEVESLRQSHSVIATRTRDEKAALFTALGDLPNSLGAIWSDEHDNPTRPVGNGGVNLRDELLMLHRIEHSSAGPHTVALLQQLGFHTAADVTIENLRSRGSTLAEDTRSYLFHWRNALADRAKMEPYEERWRLVARHRIMATVAAIIARIRSLGMDVVTAQGQLGEVQGRIAEILRQAQQSRSRAIDLEHDAESAYEAARRTRHFSDIATFLDWACSR